MTPDNRISRRNFLKHTFVLGTGSLLALTIPSSEQEVTSEVGGEWGEETPKNGEIVTTEEIDVSLSAYPAENSGNGVDYVLLTAIWPGYESKDPQNPDAWFILDKIPNNGNGLVNYANKINLRAYGIPSSKVTISFDVYAKVGRPNKSPNGTKTFDYEPATS